MQASNITCSQCGKEAFLRVHGKNGQVLIDKTGIVRYTEDPSIKNGDNLKQIASAKLLAKGEFPVGDCLNCEDEVFIKAKFPDGTILEDEVKILKKLLK